jgi:hypothetical protein
MHRNCHSNLTCKKMNSIRIVRARNLCTMQHSVDTGCDELLSNEHVFHDELHKYLDCKNAEMQTRSHTQQQSVLGVLLLIDFVFDMLLDIGLSVQHRVYSAVKAKQDPQFELAEGWHKCVFSRLPSLRCVRVDTHTTVHQDYGKWLQCLWLATHMHEVEQRRRGARVRADVPHEHSELYRKSLLFVLEHLKQLYAHVTCVSACKK